MALEKKGVCFFRLVVFGESRIGLDIKTGDPFLQAPFQLERPVVFRGGIPYASVKIIKLIEGSIPVQSEEDRHGLHIAAELVRFLFCFRDIKLVFFGLIFS